MPVPRVSSLAIAVVSSTGMSATSAGISQYFAYVVALSREKVPLRAGFVMNAVGSELAFRTLSAALLKSWYLVGAAPLTPLYTITRPTS